ncbi:helix-turn-helix domain-containing protein [Nocardia otitidiscaviarum]|uniref:MerR family transcriptional regulator n=1 Tax=Nocardia otitidiscaviarum TaxID=1823 RepID=UPI0004A6D380|nr:helix-turn-helix domain-containing protein [Nocardia otitidiscaviarum]MBF6483858.1 helix-turn-helix domain-containing protein [Nocardia otitidiscaviarum]
MQQVALLTTSEVAERLGVCGETVRRWVRGGVVRPSVTTPGGHYRFAESDLATLVLGGAA